MHILVCDDDAAFSAKVAEYAVTYFEAHEIPVQAAVCSDPEQVLAIPDLELYRIAFLDVDSRRSTALHWAASSGTAIRTSVWSMYRPIWPLRWMATRSTPTATSSNGTSPSSCPAVWRTSMRP